MINLKVPYKSQWDADANKTANDCGAASVAMILNYYGENVTTNDVFDKTGAGLGLISIAQIEKAIKSFGYTTKRIVQSTPEVLKSYLDKDIPVIALVHYGSLKSTQDKNFKGGHFFVVVGYRDDGYFVNDPNFKGSLRADGDHHFYTKSEFEKAWSDASLDGNQARSFQIINRKKESMPEKDALTECLSQHKKLVSEADKKDQAIKGLEAEVLQKETEISGLKTSIEEKETENTTLGKQVSAYKGEVTKKEAQITELQTQVADLQKDSQKDVAGETSKESMRLLVSGIVGTAVTYLYSQYPVLGQIGVEQSVAVATVVAFIFRLADKAVHTIGKNIGSEQLKAGLMRF